MLLGPNKLDLIEMWTFSALNSKTFQLIVILNINNNYRMLYFKKHLR